ncbi:flavodoxin [Ruminococcaceae bacterium OttesenSCG-928-O06]|nr:flavodoxin [Ruminococcaceae bacterium OttesenSCG-928-O06]
MSSLIAYFSRAGENYVNGTLQTLSVGNTEVAAGVVQQAAGGDLFKIAPMVAYAADYSACIDEAKQDQKRGARPELKEYLPGLDGYDTIYLGYPNYWGTMPMAVFTFLEKYDFAGKTIKPFCTHEGSGMGKSEADIKRLCPTAKVEKGLAIVGGKVQAAEEAITAWV